MKKIKLSIATPCHEDWDKMNTAEKGKFCLSCQKTVTDFSGMSDRQLAEFFKKPKSGLCGRFHPDQLEREITVARKRIPWVRYFFQFTWPAMILFLKSCGMKQQVKGTPIVNSVPAREMDHPGTGNITTIGDTTLSTIELDGIIGTTSCVKPDYIEKKTKFKTKAQDRHEKQITERVIEPVVCHPVKEINRETVNENYTQIMMGAIASRISINRISGRSTSRQPVTATPAEIKNEIVCTIFPNPVHAGGLLTISFGRMEDLPVQLQLFSVSGQLVTSVKQGAVPEATVLNFRMPDHLTTGMYILQMTNRENKMISKKIILQ